MDGSTLEIEELSMIAERKLSIRSGNEPHIGGGGLHRPSSSSSSFSLVNALQRLDRIDLRLMQLEDRRGPSMSSSESHRRCASCPPNSYQSLKVAIVNLGKHCRSLAVVLEEVQFKGTLLDRVRSLENRVLQLSYELDRESRTSSTPRKATDESGRRQQEAERKHDPSFFQPSNQGPAKQGIELCESVDRSSETNSQKKNHKSVSRHRNERKKADRNWPYRRWFAFRC